MSDIYPVKGGFISDDYYFVLTEGGLKQLQKHRSVEGVFICPSNSVAHKLLLMKLKVKIVGLDKKNESTTIDIDFDKKSAQFNIHTDDFQEAFLNPSSWVRENGPAWRIASCNCYIVTPKSSQYEARNKRLDQYIIDAKNDR